MDAILSRIRGRSKPSGTLVVLAAGNVRHGQISPDEKARAFARAGQSDGLTRVASKRRFSP